MSLKSIAILAGIFVSLFSTTGVANASGSANVPILMYHYIGNNPNAADKARDSLSVSPDKFDAQMGYLASKGYTPITFDTLYAGLSKPAVLPSKPVILTFDDGYIDFYINAAPILRKYNFHAVAFIATGLIGTSYYMNWDQIKELDKTGLFSFQAHTITHPNLLSLKPAEQSRQIVESKKTLETLLGKPVNTFAYPFGINNQTVQGVVKKSGFVGAVGTWYGRNENYGNLFNMPRIRVSGSWSISEFAKRL